MTKGEDGWYIQTPPPPVQMPVIREDDGSIRSGPTVYWMTQEEMIAKLNGAHQVAAYVPPEDVDDAG